MPQDLPSVHSVDGEARDPMTDDPDTATVVRISDGEVLTTCHTTPWIGARGLDTTATVWRSADVAGVPR